MQSFKAAVEKLKAKRETEREEKERKKAAEALTKVEAKAETLRAKATPPANNDDILQQFVRILDERLPLKPMTEPVKAEPKPRRRQEPRQAPHQEDEYEYQRPRYLPQTPAIPSVWYESLFPRR